MKLKYYLRGLGIGIIVTTVILAVSFSKKEIKMSDEEIMARAAQLGMVMQETETTEQGDTEQDPDGTDTGAKTEVVTEQTASELLEERTAAEETAQNTETAAEDVAAEAQENSANTDEETQAQQEAADAKSVGVLRLVIQKRGCLPYCMREAGGERSHFRCGDVPAVFIADRLRFQYACWQLRYSLRSVE